MHAALVALSNGVYYIYIFSHNQKIMINLYTSYNISNFFYTIGNSVIFNRPTDPVILEIGTIIDSELGEFEMINI
jgi:hypothetical protein